MAELFLHNSLTRGRERFLPLDPGNVRMYVCGPTVYDLPHLGNARPAVVFDVLARLLRRLYPRVTYVRNITDVEDKIIARAAALGEPIETVTSRVTAEYHADMQALGVLPPDEEPRATAHVAEMIALIERLIAGGHAYEAEGHVLFAVASFPEYGRLSGRSQDELIAGARVEVAPYKRHPGDFVLWKPSSPDQPGWESPWGRGRPGWHIECSAMSWRYLGDTFDIHGGGSDLLFPHHENEVAQSLCAFPGSRFARFWLHNGMLLVDGEKMAKSVGNVLTIRDVLARASGEAIRFLLLKTHYRSPLDFNEVALREASESVIGFYSTLLKLPDPSPNTRLEYGDIARWIVAPLLDDLNTPEVFARLFHIRSLAERGRPSDLRLMTNDGSPRTANLAEFKLGLKDAAWILGVFQEDPVAFLTRGVSSATKAEIDRKIRRRAEARRARDFARADAIRAELAAEGIVLEDTATGTSWRRAS